VVALCGRDWVVMDGIQASHFRRNLPARHILALHNLIRRCAQTTLACCAEKFSLLLKPDRNIVVSAGQASDKTGLPYRDYVRSESSISRTTRSNASAEHLMR